MKKESMYVKVYEALLRKILSKVKMITLFFEGRDNRRKNHFHVSLDLSSPSLFFSSEILVSLSPPLQEKVRQYSMTPEVGRRRRKEFLFDEGEYLKSVYRRLKEKQVKNQNKDDIKKMREGRDAVCFDGLLFASSLP